MKKGYNDYGPKTGWTNGPRLLERILIIELFEMIVLFNSCTPVETIFRNWVSTFLRRFSMGWVN